MKKVKTNIFFNNLNILGFRENDDVLFLTDSDSLRSNFPSEIKFHIDFAKELQATAVYFRRQLNGSYVPQVFLYDFTDRDFHQNEEKELTEIQRKIWSSGVSPLACIVYKTEIKILNCTTHIINVDKPNYLVETLNISNKAQRLYDKQFAIKIKSGIFWDEQDARKFKFSNNSAYNKLIQNIHFITKELQTFIQSDKKIDDSFINKIIVQAILIKYLEERIDNTNGKKLLSDKFFKKIDNSRTFNDVLRKGKFVELLEALNDEKTGFNGNIFCWSKEDKTKLKNLDLSLLADLLGTKKTSLGSKQLEFDFNDWRYFEFRYIPVELISRLYEEFLGTDKREKGLYYTPAHLTRLLIDESLPLSKYKEIDVLNYKILDPACGSGIFLVTAFKRLVQIWRLQNNMQQPSLETLKNILKNLYGVDEEKQAIELASFSLSLALCNELKPIEIIEKLKFDDLKEKNLITSDFFEAQNMSKLKFDLIIGNPPFKTGAIKSYNPYWEYKDEKVKIPQGQIALKFLSESLPYLKEKGLLCLIIKSSGLLYNSTSFEYKKLLFTNFNVIQILDFTALARNRTLWDNGADVAAASIFLRNEKPDIEKNILHLTFRRTKATNERIIFEIDDYDLHFIDKQTAIKNPYIWKNNLLGGGRIKTLVDKTKNIPLLESYLAENDFKVAEGFKIGSKGRLQPEFIYKIPTIPTEAINEYRIEYKALQNMPKEIKFEKIPSEFFFNTPNIIIKENIGGKRIPIFINETTGFSFQHKIISIISKNKANLENIYNSFTENNNFYRFYIFSTSSQVLINLNTVILKKDIMNIPFLSNNNQVKFSDFDNKIISDVNEFMQDFIRHGENSKAVKPIPDGLYEKVLKNYGNEFSKVLNLIYADKNKKFRLNDVIKLKNSLIAVIFKYDSKNDNVNFHNDFLKVEIKGLSDYEISKHLTVNRIIKLYPEKDTIVFIKPNQYRYWLSLFAYKDADKCFTDLSSMGF